MLKKLKKIKSLKIFSLKKFLKPIKPEPQTEVDKLNAYIYSYWDRMTFHTRLRELKKWVKWSDWTLIKLPNAYIIPSQTEFPEMFYWDSYFTILGLLVHDRHKLAKGMVDNCLYLVHKYGFVPNANRTFYLTRSQPPYLSQMVWEIYKIYQDKDWLKKAYELLLKEYEEYWTREPKLVPQYGLSRFYDASGKDHEAENESGWDTTCRYDHRCSQILSIDLNCNLYQYEIDLFAIAKEIDLTGPKVERWRSLAEKRKALINERFWHEADGLYYDFDFRRNTSLPYKTLAAYYPMWCGLATKEQAEKLVENLRLFIQPGGLSTCDQNYGEYDHQWNHPNGWAPLQYIVITGLENYGYTELAREMAQRWVNMVTEDYLKTKVVWEKYDVVQKTKGFDDYRYKTPAGFGWSNAVTVWLMDYLGYDVKRK